MRTLSESLDILAAEIAAAPNDTNTHRKKTAALARLARQTEMNTETREHAAEKEISKLNAALEEIETHAGTIDPATAPENYNQRAAAVIQQIKIERAELDATRARRNEEADRMT